MTTVTIVRVYLTEAEKKLTPLLKYLHGEAALRGVTVFRGITGFGQSREMHSSSLVDLSLDLPLVVEFFDVPDKISTVMARMKEIITPAHIVSWSAKMEE